MFDCKDIDLRIEFAIDNRLSSEQKLLFFDHLARCSLCRVLYVSMSLTAGRDDDSPAAAVTESAACPLMPQAAPERTLKRGERLDAIQPGSNTGIRNRRLPRAGSESDGACALYDYAALSSHAGSGAVEQAVRRDIGRRSLWSLAICGSLIGLIVTVIVLSQRGNENVGPAGAPMQAVGPNTAEPVEEQPSEYSEKNARLGKIDGLLHQAELAMDAKDWDKARLSLAEARKVEGIAAQRVRLEDLAGRVAKEKRHQAAFEELLAAAQKLRMLVMFEELGKIPEDSAYRADSRDTALEAVRARVPHLLRRGDCKALDSLIAMTLLVFPEVRDELQRQRATCTQAAANDVQAPASSSARDAAKLLLNEAHGAYMGEMFRAASIPCQELRRLGQVNEEVATVCGLTACKLKDHQTAAWYYGRPVGLTVRGVIAQACLEEGLDVQK